MKTIHTLRATALAATLAIYSAGAIAQTDSIIKKEIETGAFTGVIAGGNFNIVLSEALTTKVVVETISKNQENVSATVNNENNLVITSNGKANAKTTLRIYAPTINYIKLSGSANLITNSDLIESQLHIVMSGAAEANLTIVTTNLETEVSGAAELKLTGVTTNHASQVSGAGELKAINLVTTNTTAKLSGAGHAQVNAKNELNAKISGASSISFKEEPAVKNIDVSGAGSVTKKEEDTEITKAEMNANGGSDTTRFKFKNKHIIIIDGNDANKKNEAKIEKKKTQTWNHWAGVEFGFNTLLNYKNTNDLASEYSYLQSPSKSYHVAVNIIEKGFKLYKNNIKLVTGAGVEFENYSIKNNVTLNTNGILPTYTPVLTLPQAVSMSKNKLRANYITVPLMLDFNSSKKEKKNWHITTGIIAAWRVNSFSKQTIVVNDAGTTTKVKDDFGLNDFKFSATVRAGYRGINVFANYGFTTLFNKTNNPDFYPVTLGITVWPFL